MFKLILEKAEEPEIKLPTSAGSSKSKRVPTVENSERDGNTRPPYLPPEKSVQVRKQQLELDMEQQTGSKSGKE